MMSPSPPRQRRRRRERDAPPREAAEDDPSPPREPRRREGPSGSPTRRDRRDPEAEEATMVTSPPPRRWARRDLKAGLLTAKEFREEVRKIKLDEELRHAAMDPSLPGEGARPVFRDKQGRPVFRDKQGRRIRISKHQMLSGSADEHEHGGLELGTGLAQRFEAAARSRELEAESSRSRPLARSKDDPELDAMQRSRARWGDPMAHLVEQAEEEESGAMRDLGDDEEMRGSGFVVPRDVPGNSWMRRGVDPPANRYGVKPGRHWDGVDRGNGFESSGVTVEEEEEKKRPLWYVSES